MCSTLRLLDCPDADFRRDAKWRDLKNLRRTLIGDRPLLLLYPIDRDSEPRTGSKERVSLGAVGDQVGLGIVFPGSTSGSGGYYHVDLNPEDSEQLDELEAEINEMETLGLV